MNEPSPNHTFSKAPHSRYKSLLLRDFRTVKDGQVICYNIGTAAHPFGNLAVLQKHLPEAQVTVWADAPLAKDLAELMARRFPQVPVVTGVLSQGQASSPELAAAIEQADLFLVSSGNGIAPSVGASLLEFRYSTGKPAAAYAIGCRQSQLPLLDELESASFRDSPSLELARCANKQRICWAPDAVFDFDCADEPYAQEFLVRHALTPGDFVCCIPGYRVTPRWEFFGGPASPEIMRRNAEAAVGDETLLCEAIIHAVRSHGQKVLLCAEQIPEMSLLQPLHQRLPQDVADACVVLPHFWGPAEARGVYRQSAGVFGIEMHSQVMALGNGIPAAVFRHRGFGTKSTMWKDLGIPEWLLDIDEPDSTTKACAIVDDLLANPTATRQKVLHCRERIDQAAAAAIAMQFGQT